MSELVRRIQQLVRKSSSRPRTSAIGPGGSSNRRYIFILGHMRSGSSLLVHLLNSNPEIAGFGESHLSYSDLRALVQLELRVKEMLGQSQLDERYVLDKILHNDLVLSPELLGDPRIRFVFLIRDPASTIRSAARLWRSNPNAPWHEATAFKSHYIGRLQYLVETVPQIQGGRCLLVTYDALIHQTNQTFSAIEQFLELSVPLREDYDVLPFTGKPGIGDPSPRLRTGHLLRIPREASTQPQSDVPDDVTRQYRLTHRGLAKLCTSYSAVEAA